MNTSASKKQGVTLIIIHKPKDLSPSNGGSLLRFAICSEPFSAITFSHLNRNSFGRINSKTTIAIPQDWAKPTQKVKSNIIYYRQNISVPSELLDSPKANRWFVISNGRFATQIAYNRLYKILDKLQADVITVNAVPQLQASHEKLLINSQDKLIGFRRLYDDMVQPALTPADWPHHIFARADVFGGLLVDGALLQDFSGFLDCCYSNSLTVRSVNIGGTVFDLESEEGLLNFFTSSLGPDVNNGYQNQIFSTYDTQMSPNARLFGKILLGQNVCIGKDVIIAGPAIIGNNVKIAQGTVIRTSIIGSDVSVPDNLLIQNCVIKDPQYNWRHLTGKNNNSKQTCCRRFSLNRLKACNDSFRIWPGLSYAGCLKRIADIVMAVIVLALFAPVIPIIALVIKLTSRGPVFFKDDRQGLHGRPFNCLKFRTMLLGADKIQDKLRVLNQADGPQFKMSNDPRLSTVGRFLRDTYIDEIPQFINVLLGQMSLVGPRPSPESENTLCPHWRDARLSVRPGITGLWQLCRTRRPMKDFQEWIYYDIKYVKNLSAKLDLWICWQTAKKLIDGFISQF